MKLAFIKVGGDSMKRKYLLASHGKLAEGLQSSLNILADKGKDFQVINAYVTEDDYTPEVVEFIHSINKDEQAVIFTDLFGGSVNQKIVTEVMNSNNENIFVVSNTNLAIILSILFVGAENLTSEIIEGCIADSQVALVSTTLIQEEEETFF